LGEATIIGIVAALSVGILPIGLGQYPLGFISIPGALIVIGGSLSMTLAVIMFRQFAQSSDVIKQAFVYRQHKLTGLIDEIEELSQIAGHDGAPVLEGQDISCPFMAKGMRFLTTLLRHADRTGSRSAYHD